MDKCAVIVSGALILTAGASGEKARNVFKFSSSHLIFYRAKKAFWKLNNVFCMRCRLGGFLQQEKCVEKGPKMVNVNVNKRHLPKHLELLQNSYNLLEGGKHHSLNECY